MDAKHAKTLSGVLVAMFLGSVFLAAIPPVAAQDPNPDKPDAVFDATTDTWVNARATPYGRKNLTLASEPHGWDFLVTPAGTSGGITYNSSWDVTFTNLTQSGTYAFGPCAQGNCTTPGVVTTQTAYDDGAHTGKYNVTFSASDIGATSPSNGKFDQVGVWGLWRSGVLVGRVLVNATENLRVTLSQNAFTYSSSSIGFRVTVTDLATGAPVPGAFVQINRTAGATESVHQNLGLTTSSGTRDWTGSTPEAGTYKVRVWKQAGAGASGGLPEFMGVTTLTIGPATLSPTAVTVDVLRGFDGAVEFNFTYPSGLPAFAVRGATNEQLPNTAGAVTKSYRVNVTHPSGCYVRFTGTTTTPTADTTGSTCTAATVGTLANLLDILANGADGAAKGNMRFYGNGTAGWASGQYTMVVEINSAGTQELTFDVNGKPLGDAEYSTTVRWNPGTPADVNIEVTSGLTNGKLDIKAPQNLDSNGFPTDSPIQIRVTGSYKSQHPVGKRGGGCINPTVPVPHGCWDAFKTQTNVTIEGDYLKIVDAAGNPIAPTIGTMDYATGLFTISNLYPSKGSGEIRVNINWKNATWTKVIPIGKGASIEADKDTIVVDTATPITFTLKGMPAGALDPYGEVRLYRISAAGTTAAISSTPKFLSGNGNEGLGLDGKYAFNLKEATLGTYLAVGKVGQTHTNWTYMVFRVVPAHDLLSTVVKNDAVLAGKPTEISVNVTKADGGVYPTSENPRFWFLNSGELKNFLENGTLPTNAQVPARADLTPGSVYQVNGRIVSYNFSSMNLVPDTYTVYVKSADAKHDNLQAMPKVQAHHARVAFSPTAVMNNTDIEANTTITATVTDWLGNPLNGTLVWDPESKGMAQFYGSNVTGQQSNGCTSRHTPYGCQLPTKPFIKVVDGKATFKATGWKLGSIRFEFDPTATTTTTRTSAFPDVLGTFEVVAPNVHVTPSKIPVGTTSSVVVTVTDLNGAPLRNIPVQICGNPIGGTSATTGCTGKRPTDVSGIARVGVSPFATGNLTLVINGTATPTVVEVFAGLNIRTDPAEPKVGDLVAVTIAQPGRTGEAGVSVSIADATGAVVRGPLETDSSGLVSWTPTKEGIYTITVSKEGFETNTLDVTVGVRAPPPPAPEARFTLSDLQVSPSTVTLGSGVTVTAKVTNSGNADGTATMQLRVNGATFDTKAVPVPQGTSETVLFQFTPTAAADYQLSVRIAGGSELSPQTLKVNAPTAPPPGNNQGGNPPSQQPQGVPGFEAVLALAAIGAAFVILRRKQ